MKAKALFKEYVSLPIGLFIAVGWAFGATHPGGLLVMLLPLFIWDFFLRNKPERVGRILNVLISAWDTAVIAAFIWLPIVFLSRFLAPDLFVRGGDEYSGIEVGGFYLIAVLVHLVKIIYFPKAFLFTSERGQQ